MCRVGSQWGHYPWVFLSYVCAWFMGYRIHWNNFSCECNFLVFSKTFLNRISLLLACFSMHMAFPSRLTHPDSYMRKVIQSEYTEHIPLMQPMQLMKPVKFFFLASHPQSAGAGRVGPSPKFLLMDQTTDILYKWIRAHVPYGMDWIHYIWFG